MSDKSIRWRFYAIVAALLMLEFAAILTWGIGAYVGFGLGGLVCVAYVAYNDAASRDDGEEQWGLVVEEPGTGSQAVPDFSKRKASNGLQNRNRARSRMSRVQTSRLGA